MDIIAVWLIDCFFFPAGLCYVLYVSHKLISSHWVLAFLYLILFVYTFFLSKQTKHGRNKVSFYFFLFICGCAKCLLREQCVGSSTRVDALCSSCSLQKYLERWPAALYEPGQSVLMLMKGSKIPRIELNTVHLYQHYSLFMHNKLQYSWHGDYCEWVRPAQLPVLTEAWAPSLLEQHPQYIPHWDHAGYTIILCSVM